MTLGLMIMVIFAFAMKVASIGIISRPETNLPGGKTKDSCPICGVQLVTADALNINTYASVAGIPFPCCTSHIGHEGNNKNTCLLCGA